MQSIKRVWNLLLVVCLIVTAIPLAAVSVQAYSLPDIDYYGYSTLTDVQKKVYDRLDESLQSSEPGKKIDIPTSWKVPIEDLKLIVEMYVSDHPDCFWFKGAYSYSYITGNYAVALTPKIKISGKTPSSTELQTAKNQFDSATATVLNEMKTAGVTSDYEKALWLHDKVADLVTYTYTDNDQIAYGALVEGKAVCAGYSRLYQYLLQCVGIEAWTVRGDSIDPSSGKLVAHAWTLMWLGTNDICLYSDVTWDDHGEQLYHLFFARDYNAFSGKGASSDHIPDSQFFATRLPECDNSCKDQYVFTDQNIITGTVTASAVAQRLTLGDDNRTFTGTFYDPDGKISAWLSGSGNLNLLGGELGLNGFSISRAYIDGITAGTELHLKIVSSTTITPTTVKVNGTVTSFDSDTKDTSNDTVTIKLYEGNSATAKYSTTCTGTSANYSISGVKAGTYTMKVSKDDHVTREYTVTVGKSNVTQNVKIHLLGDINGDGNITIVDYGRANSHAKGKSTLTGYELLCADTVKFDGNVTVADAARINSHAKGKSLLW